MTEEPTNTPGTREINPAQRGEHMNEVPMPEKRTGDKPPLRDPGTMDNQQGGRDTEERGKWDGDTR